MRKLYPYIAITALITLLIYSIIKYSKDNPKVKVDKGYWIPYEDVNS